MITRQGNLFQCDNVDLVLKTLSACLNNQQAHKKKYRPGGNIAAKMDPKKAILQRNTNI